MIEAGVACKDIGAFTTVDRRHRPGHAADAVALAGVVGRGVEDEQSGPDREDRSHRAAAQREGGCGGQRERRDQRQGIMVKNAPIIAKAISAKPSQMRVNVSAGCFGRLRQA